MGLKGPTQYSPGLSPGDSVQFTWPERALQATMIDMAQSLHSLGVHMIFSTKGRAPLLTPDIRPRVHAYLARVLDDLGCRSIAVGGVKDHVHLLCRFTKLHSTSHVLQIVKQESSKVVKTLSPSLRDFSWQNGYG